MSGFVGLTQHDALAQGGNNLGQEADILRTQVQGLIADMEKDKNAVQGHTLAGFQAAKAQLVERFDELIAFCQRQGVDLGEAQQQVDVTDTGGADAMSAATASLGGVSLATSIR